MPAIATKMPTLPNANIVKPSYPASNIIPCTTRLVDVPIRVQIPPSIDVYKRQLYNNRKEYKLNGFALGVTYNPSFHPQLRVIAEYDLSLIHI